MGAPYKVVTNNCGCHPETCCCDDYWIVDANGEKVDSHYKRADAENIVELMNAASKGPEVIEKMLCESMFIQFRPNVLYRFVVDEHCAVCRAYRDTANSIPPVM